MVHKLGLGIWRSVLGYPLLCFLSALSYCTLFGGLINKVCVNNNCPWNIDPFITRGPIYWRWESVHADVHAATGLAARNFARPSCFLVHVHFYFVTAGIEGEICYFLVNEGSYTPFIWRKKLSRERGSDHHPAKST